MESAIARRVGGFVLLLLLAVPAAAQNKVPSARPLEALVKSSLMSLNDANLTGDYRVFYDVSETERVVSVRAIRYKPQRKATQEIL